MKFENSVAQERKDTGGLEAFSVERANRALVLVRKVVADIVAQHHELTRLGDQRRDLVECVGNKERIETLNRQISGYVGSLSELQRELVTIGCVLRDQRSGVVQFPALRHGERVWLSWRLGESQIGFWHPLNDAPSKRRPLGNDFN